MPALPSPLMLLALCAALGAAQPGGTGSALLPAGGGQNPAAAQAKITIRDYEPWVKTAHVGDFLVKRYPDGRTNRQEVTAIDQETLTVAFSDAQKGTHFGDVRYRRRPAAKKASGKPDQARSLPEPELTQQSVGKTEVNGRSVTCMIYTGRDCVGMMELNGVRQEMWSAIERQVSPDVPFGGMIREMRARSKPMQSINGKVEGWKPMPGDGKVARFLNPDPPTEIAFEVVDFGIGKAGGK